jgi:hypothetical protein
MKASFSGFKTMVKDEYRVELKDPRLYQQLAREIE